MYGWPLSKVETLKIHSVSLFVFVLNLCNESCASLCIILIVLCLFGLIRLGMVERTHADSNYLSGLLTPDLLLRLEKLYCVCFYIVWLVGFLVYMSSDLSTGWRCYKVNFGCIRICILPYIHLILQNRSKLFSSNRRLLIH